MLPLLLLGVSLSLLVGAEASAVAAEDSRAAPLPAAASDRVARTARSAAPLLEGAFAAQHTAQAIFNASSAEAAEAACQEPLRYAGLLDRLAAGGVLPGAPERAAAPATALGAGAVAAAAPSSSASPSASHGRNATHAPDPPAADVSARTRQGSSPRAEQAPLDIAVVFHGRYSGMRYGHVWEYVNALYCACALPRKLGGWRWLVRLLLPAGPPGGALLAEAEALLHSPTQYGLAVERHPWVPYCVGGAQYRQCHSHGAAPPGARARVVVVLGLEEGPRRLRGRAAEFRGDSLRVLGLLPPQAAGGGEDEGRRAGGRGGPRVRTAPAGPPPRSPASAGARQPAASHRPHAGTAPGGVEPAAHPSPGPAAAPAAGAPDPRPTLLYVRSARWTNGRRVADEEVLVRALREWSARAHGARVRFEAVHAHAVPGGLRAELRLFAGAAAVVSLFGSALHNCRFMAPGAVVVELHGALHDDGGSHYQYTNLCGADAQLLHAPYAVRPRRRRRARDGGGDNASGGELLRSSAGEANSPHLAVVDVEDVVGFVSRFFPPDPCAAPPPWGSVMREYWSGLREMGVGRGLKRPMSTPPHYRRVVRRLAKRRSCPEAAYSYQHQMLGMLTGSAAAGEYSDAGNRGQ